MAVVRRVRPQVMVIYGDDQSGYPHPDHLRVHDAGVAAFRAAGDADTVSRARDRRGSRPKLYYTVFSAARFRAIHEKFVELGLESPFDEGWRKRWDEMPDEVVTTEVDITGYTDVRRQALLAHATQVDPNSSSGSGCRPR